MINRIRLSSRDQQVLRTLQVSPHTTWQLARLYFPNRKKASERLNRLYQNRYLRRLERPVLPINGRPEYIYFCSKRQLSPSYSSVEHTLAIAEFHTRFITWLYHQPLLTGHFLFQSEFLPLNDGSLIPDACFIVANMERQLLFFLEIDRGTETLVGRFYSLQDKLHRYCDYFDSGLYAEDLSRFGQFKGFRVAILTESLSRMQNLRELAFSCEADFTIFNCLSHDRSNDLSSGWIAWNASPINLFGQKELSKEIVEDSVDS